MDGNQKQITIDLEHFKLGGRTTRKKREPTIPKIKVKSTLSKEKKVKPSTLKRNLIRIIRNHQEQQRKKEKPPSSTGVSNPKSPSSTIASAVPTNDVVKSDFDKSIEFFDELEKSKKDTSIKDAIHNHTLRNSQPYPHPEKHGGNHRNPSSVDLDPVLLDCPTTTQSIHIKTPPPPYGCLKNGSLPTYRVWKNQTQRNYPPPNQNANPIQNPIVQTTSHLHYNNPYSSVKKPRTEIDIPVSAQQMNYQTRLHDTIKEMSQINQYDHLKRTTSLRKQGGNHSNQSIWKPSKNQKRIIRRTFRTGKSKVHPRVSVLVANKTIRNNTNLKKLELLETPIQEVKRYLKKQGFIKAGTNTPNDVLRQMYECVNMICGEVKNHNPENLLYNYFNDVENDALPLPH
jgi:hypothetical protein